MAINQRAVFTCSICGYRSCVLLVDTCEPPPESCPFVGKENCFASWFELQTPPTADTAESANLHPPTTAAQNSEA